MTIYYETNESNNRIFYYLAVTGLTEDQKASIFDSLYTEEAMTKAKYSAELVAQEKEKLQNGLVSLNPIQYSIPNTSIWFARLAKILTPEQAEDLDLIPTIKHLNSRVRYADGPIQLGHGSMILPYEKPSTQDTTEDSTPNAENNTPQPNYEQQVRILAQKLGGNQYGKILSFVHLDGLTDSSRLELMYEFMSRYGHDEKTELDAILKALSCNFVPLNPTCYRMSEEEQEAEMYNRIDADKYDIFYSALHNPEVQKWANEAAQESNLNQLKRHTFTMDCEVAPIPYRIRQAANQPETTPEQKEPPVVESQPVEMIMLHLHQTGNDMLFVDSKEFTNGKPLTGYEFSACHRFLETYFNNDWQEGGSPIYCERMLMRQLVAQDMLLRGYILVSRFNLHSPTCIDTEKINEFLHKTFGDKFQRLPDEMENCADYVIREVVKTHARWAWDDASLTGTPAQIPSYPDCGKCAPGITVFICGNLNEVLGLPLVFEAENVVMAPTEPKPAKTGPVPTPELTPEEKEIIIKKGTKVRIDTEKLNEVDPDSILAWFLDHGDTDTVFTVMDYRPASFPNAPFVLDGLLSDTSFAASELIIVEDDS